MLHPAFLPSPLMMRHAGPGGAAWDRKGIAETRKAAVTEVVTPLFMRGCMKKY
jgi:hypothetical protein